MTSTKGQPLTAGAPAPGTAAESRGGWWRPVRQRRPGWVAAAITFAVLAVLINMHLIRSAGERMPVVRVVRDVPVGRALTQADLGTAMVAVDTGVQTIPGQQLQRLVGMRAAVGLHHGSLLTGSQVTVRLTPQPGQALVTITLRPSQLPPRGLPAGSPVRIMPTSGTPDDDTTADGSPGGSPASEGATGIPATVDQVGAVDTEGAVAVALLVAEADSSRVAHLAPGQITLVVTAPGS
jgi:hypothetical protein